MYKVLLKNRRVFASLFAFRERRKEKKRRNVREEKRKDQERKEIYIQELNVIQEIIAVNVYLFYLLAFSVGAK